MILTSIGYVSAMWFRDAVIANAIVDYILYGAKVVLIKKYKLNRKIENIQ